MLSSVKAPSFIDQIDALPPLPAIVEQILEVSESPNWSAIDLAKVLSGDQAVAAKVLRVANSPFYGARGNVTEVSRAVVRLGSVAVRNLVIGIRARDALPSSSAHEREHALLWRHSIVAAASCDLIARRIGFQRPEEAFVGGLLHDIGQLAMVTFQPKAFQEVLKAQGTGVRFLELERSLLGLDHTQAGSRILTRWRLPCVLSLVARHHHDQGPPEGDSDARLLAIVMLGDIFAHLVGVGLDVPVGSSQRAVALAQFLKMSDSDQVNVIGRLEGRIQETMEMFDVTDTTSMTMEPVSPRGAIWVADDGSIPNPIGQLLLEQQGYEVRRVAPTNLASDVSHDDLIIIDLSEGANAARGLARVLVERGLRKVVVFFNPGEEGGVRQRDSEIGVCEIPRFFTAFDIRWVEKELRQ